MLCKVSLYQRPSTIKHSTINPCLAPSHPVLRSPDFIQRINTVYTGRYWYWIHQYNGALVQCYWKLFLFNISNRDINIKAILSDQGELFTHIIYASSFLYRGNPNVCTINREITKCTILSTRTVDKWFTLSMTEYWVGFNGVWVRVTHPTFTFLKDTNWFVPRNFQGQIAPYHTSYMLLYH